MLDAAGRPTVLSGSDLRYVAIEGFTLRGAATHGINIDDGGSYDTPAEHLVLRGLTIAGAGSGGNNDCIKLSGVDRFFVLENEVRGCNQGEIIDMVGCHEGYIAGNYFHDPVASGVQTKGGSADMRPDPVGVLELPLDGDSRAGSGLPRDRDFATGDRHVAPDDPAHLEDDDARAAHLAGRLKASRSGRIEVGDLDYAPAAPAPGDGPETFRAGKSRQWAAWDGRESRRGHGQQERGEI